MGKVTLLLAGGIGYVLGARAGRERYDQIMASVNKAWGSEPVQDAVEQVKDQAPQVAHKVSDSAKSVADRAVSKVRGEDSDEDDAATSGAAPGSGTPGG